MTTFDLEQLVSLLQSERDVDELRELPGDFEDQVSELIKCLKLGADSAEHYQEKDLLYDQLKNFVLTYQGLMDKRTQKILLYASNGQPVRRESLLGYEWSLYDQVKHLVWDHNSIVMEPVNLAFRRPQQ
jgi:DNA replication initiation complex subunit (GINS family)